MYMSNTIIMINVCHVILILQSQEHLKNLGTAVEIVSVHTDLHRHIVPIKG